MDNRKNGQDMVDEIIVVNDDKKEQLDLFREALIPWFNDNGRDLPWRKTRDPYSILVSEIMLQQTNVDIVIPVYNQFLRVFPTIQNLAAASLKDVKKITDQLGYKRRGVFLLEIAKAIVKQKQGIIPDNLSDLLKFKGIGRYTAGAILSFAFEKQDRTAAIVDVNVERVFSRVFGFWNWERTAKFNKKVWGLAELLIDSADVWKINQGILDLGATICVSTKPKCYLCPMTNFCLYYIEVIPKIIPLDNFL